MLPFDQHYQTPLVPHTGKAGEVSCQRTQQSRQREPATHWIWDKLLPTTLALTDLSWSLRSHSVLHSLPGFHPISQTPKSLPQMTLKSSLKKAGQKRWPAQSWDRNAGLKVSGITTVTQNTVMVRDPAAHARSLYSNQHMSRSVWSLPPTG